MRICIVGTGYVGLVTGACFAEMGNAVTCVDADQNKIDVLNRGELPIFEPGLGTLVAHNKMEGRLRFTTSLPDAIREVEAVFIAVGTPPNDDGTANLDHVLNVARGIGRAIAGHTIVVIKSTVLVGTADRIREVIKEELDRRSVTFGFDVVANPEFLKEGAAVNDFMRPDRIVIGSDSPKAIEAMQRLYTPFMRIHDIMMVMGVRDAEMTKYAANAMLATRISFMNEIASLCERVSVDVENVRRGIGSDTRIGYSFIYPGCGFGGSCLPKDINALMNLGKQVGFKLEILEMVYKRNVEQKRRLFEKVVDRFGPVLDGHVFAVWGLSFKPETDDVREAASAVLIELLIRHGGRVNAFDPIAINSFRKATNADWIAQGRLRLVDNQYGALSGASAVILVTEWRQFRNPDLDKMKQMLKTPVIFDGRNQYDPNRIREQGFEYIGIGR